MGNYKSARIIPSTYQGIVQAPGPPYTVVVTGLDDPITGVTGPRFQYI